MNKNENSDARPTRSSSTDRSNTNKKIVLDTLASRSLLLAKTEGNISVSSTGDHDAPEGITTIQIKWFDGKEILIAKMFEDDLIATLKEV